MMLDLSTLLERQAKRVRRKPSDAGLSLELATLALMSASAIRRLSDKCGHVPMVECTERTRARRKKNKPLEAPCLSG